MPLAIIFIAICAMVVFTIPQVPRAKSPELVCVEQAPSHEARLACMKAAADCRAGK